MASPPRQRILALLVLSSFASCPDALQVLPSLEARQNLVPLKLFTIASCRCQRMPTPPRQRAAAVSAKPASLSASLSANLIAACLMWGTHASPCSALEMPPLDLAAAVSAASSSSTSSAPVGSSLLEPLALPAGLALALVLALGTLVQSNWDSSPPNSGSDGSSSSSSSHSSSSSDVDIKESNASSSSFEEELQTAAITVESSPTNGEVGAAQSNTAASSTAHSSAPSPVVVSRQQQESADEVWRLGSEVYRLEALLARSQASKEEAEAALADYK